MSATNSITIAGNLTEDPELRYTPSSVPVASLRVAVNRRVQGAGGKGKTAPTASARWERGATLAEHVTASLSRGDRVIVNGRLTSRSYEAKDGSKRTTVEIQADDLAPSLRWAAASITRAIRHTADELPPT